MKRAIKSFVIPIALFCLVILFSWQWAKVLERPAVASNLKLSISISDDEPIEPIPLTIALDQGKVALGNKLFHEPQLSHDNTISCATCHDLTKGGTDQRVFSIGINNQEGPINSPTVLNSGFNFRQFWDGRARTLEEQVEGPTHAAKEMASNWDEILGKLKRSPKYVSTFKQLYADGLTDNNIKDAIATFERSLYTPNSRFDKFLRGNTDVLTSDEKEGYRLFKDYGCIACHQGVLLGGNMFQKFGVFGNYFQDRGNITEADMGRYNVTGQEEDRHSFKVPTLRNIELTWPYFHDGSAKTLDEAVKVMIHYQLGREASQQDIDLIVHFLTSLTGELEGSSL